MTLRAADAQLLVHVVAGCGMARFAAVACLHPQQCVQERLAAALSEFGTGMATVAGHAVLLGQFLVERHLQLGCTGSRHGLDRQPLGRAQADVRQLVAGDAAIGARTTQGRVAGKTIRGQGRVIGHQRAWADHQVRVDKCQRHQHQQVGDDHSPQPAAFHRQSQKRNTAAMWATARTAKASVIGKCTERHCFTASKVRLSL